MARVRLAPPRADHSGVAGAAAGGVVLDDLAVLERARRDRAAARTRSSKATPRPGSGGGRSRRATGRVGLLRILQSRRHQQRRGPSSSPAPTRSAARGRSSRRGPTRGGPSSGWTTARGRRSSSTARPRASFEAGRPRPAVTPSRAVRPNARATHRGFDPVGRARMGHRADAPADLRHPVHQALQVVRLAARAVASPRRPAPSRCARRPVSIAISPKKSPSRRRIVRRPRSSTSTCPRR